MKCHLKPTFVECFQWTGGPDQTEDPEWMVEAIEKGDAWIRHHPQRGPLLVIHTDDGDKEAKLGDYILNNRVSGIYPISHSKFNELYEVVDNDTN